MRDMQAKKWKERIKCYRVGSAFKGCMHCGMKAWNKKGTKQIFVTGLDVVRSYKPKNSGWTYLCMECGAKDEKCWQGAWDIGMEPRIIPRDGISPFKGERQSDGYVPETLSQWRRAQREKFTGEGDGKNVPKVKPLSEEEKELMSLKAELAAIKVALGIQ